MTACCPHCHRPYDEPPVDPVDEGLGRAEMLRAACKLRGVWISPDGFVRECDAADLMGVTPKTLKNRRSLHDPKLPAHEKRAGRTLYALASIAAWMDAA